MYEFDVSFSKMVRDLPDSGVIAAVLPPVSSAERGLTTTLWLGEKSALCKGSDILVKSRVTAQVGFVETVGVTAFSMVDCLTVGLCTVIIVCAVVLWAQQFCWCACTCLPVLYCVFIYLVA